MANRTAYQALQAEAQRRGYPEVFRRDLTEHDRNALARRDAPTQFGWVLRRAGTHFWPPDGQAAERVRLVQLVDQQKGGGDDPHFYWYDGRRLVEVSPDELVRRLTAAARSAALAESLAADVRKRGIAFRD